MRSTRWALLGAVVATLGAAVVWPEGVERVGRIAILAVGAGLVVDLTLAVRHSLPSEINAPFAPPPRRSPPPWRPSGLTELQRDLRLMAVTGAGRSLSASTRLRRTCHAAAQERLRPRRLDLDRPGDRGAAREVLGAEVYDFIVGDAPAASVDDLLAAVSPQGAGTPGRGGSA
ncbi:MAG TPA: hypothetical protein VID93_10620 [Acidimicrobiales bacterium]